VFGEGVPEREELERREGSDSVFEWDDENRTDDCRGEERVVVRIGDEGGMVPLLGRDLDLGGD
jgi:hypothetical protein